MKNYLIVKWGVLICLVLIINQGIGQNLQVPADLSKLVEQSFLKYPKLDEMKDLVKLGEVRVALGKAGYLPVANGDISYRRIFPTDPISIPSGSGTPGEIHILPADNYNAGITLVQPIIDFKTSAGINKSISELTTSKDNLEGFKLQLAYQIAQLYYGILFLNKSLVVQRQQLDLIQSNIRQIQVKIKNGDALAYDLVSMQVKYTNVENYTADLQNQLNRQYNLMNMFTGNSGFGYISDFTFNVSVFNLATDSIFSIAASNNVDIKTANNRITTAKWDVVASNKLELPTLNLIAGSGIRNGFTPDINQKRFNYSVGAALNIPIFSGSRPYLQKKMALINLDASNSALETQRLTLNKDLMNALEDLKKNKTKLLGSDTLIVQATMAQNLANDRYKNGVITTLELLTAQTNYQDALLGRLQYEYYLLLTNLEINRLVGKNWW